MNKNVPIYTLIVSYVHHAKRFVNRRRRGGWGGGAYITSNITYQF